MLRRYAEPLLPLSCPVDQAFLWNLGWPLHGDYRQAQQAGDVGAMLRIRLQVLQERRVRRVGARQENPVDVRVVAATSRNVDQMVERGEFRRDLYYRINVVRIDLPPLRVRGDDIGLLAEHFANKAAHEMGRSLGGLSTDVYQVLRGYHWPGNVRELQNVVRRAIAMTRSPMAGIDDLPDDVVAAAGRTAGAEAGAIGFFAQRAEQAEAWVECVSGAFLSAYLAKAKGSSFLPASERELRMLLDVCLLEKAVYEVCYELNNRPDWVAIPLRGITRILDRSGA